MSETEITELLQPYVRERVEIPRGYAPLTVAIRLTTEGHIARSIYDTLRGTDFLVTLQNGEIEFWRPRIPKRQAYIDTGILREGERGVTN